MADPRQSLDRSASERHMTGAIDIFRTDPSARALAVNGDRVAADDAGQLRWQHPSMLSDVLSWAFLGRAVDGAPLLAAVVPVAEGMVSLRSLATEAPSAETEAAITAVALGRWHLDARFCPACGSATELIDAGWSRRCTACGRQHFPRTDPAIITAVTRADDPDLLLLGSNVAWEQQRYSCFAGFADAGESLERAVVRELSEEAGIRVHRLRYAGSQPWPYPRSLMLGFFAEAVDPGVARPDGEEILDVRWFHRDEIGEALSGRGELLLPGPLSIASRLISAWYEGGSAQYGAGR